MAEGELSSPQDRSQEAAEGLFERWLDQWLDGEGEAPEAFLARHPEFASQVKGFLAARQAFQAIRAGGEPAEASRLEPGQRLGEDYELLTELGRGGMGVVWLARQRSLNRLVALKCLPLGLAAFARSNDRFIREAQAIAQLRHSGIVTVYALELEPARGGPYLAMEYVPGVPLDRLLAALQGRSPQRLTEEDLYMWSSAFPGARNRRWDRKASSDSGQEATQAFAAVSWRRWPRPWPTPMSRGSSIGM